MGLERAVAVYKPVYFKLTKKKRSFWTISVSILFVVVSLSVGFIIAWLNQAAKVKYYCGRKAAFSNRYASFIYVSNVVGYASGFVFNCIAYCKAKTLISKSDKNTNMTRLRYYIVIACMSTVLVSIPNIIALADVIFGKIADAISKPSVWATSVNSGLNFFVYFALNLEFRKRVLQLIGRGVRSSGIVKLSTADNTMNSKQ
ncbi:hypothetical protein PMAYCL1PPCAC_09442 [Pristionchus mayeri]|uniref:G-protein coupled receptors family 1 profile domain-containing protein n=1 Tax=Pristionchus mayeri TaxID=1317129 RepID=A0AAN4ZDL2_9BILA|nr:hypothetical protein PMAYCL1PPCAC_09442 [Pristionchus mayeri]